jgi:hypothetical protein
MRMSLFRSAILRAQRAVFAVYVFGGLLSAQQVIGFYNGAITPFGAGGQPDRRVQRKL